MEQIRRWVGDTRIRWGMDSGHRSRIGLPGHPENTWMAGLERLFLGYAMPGREERLFLDILPHDAVEGIEAETLGRLAEFLDGLFRGLTELGRARNPSEWSDLLSSLLDRFFAADEETEREFQTIRGTIQGLQSRCAQAGFDAPVSLDVVRRYLKENFARQGFGAGFISGAVTCCAMLPMRSIPFRVICLLGMNHDGYPRASATMGFDLKAAHPRPGDRSRRNDDRYLFLEALISARRKLVITYVGQSLNDNSAAPPSVLVSEMLDYIERGFVPAGRTIGAPLLTAHRLQAFHPDYFTEGTDLFSYDSESGLAARRLLERRREPHPFIAAPLAEAGEDWKSVDIEDLDRFFRHPCRFFLERRLATELVEGEAVPEEEEIFELKGLDKYGMEQLLVERALAGRDLDRMYPVFRAAALLPLGRVGESLYTTLAEEALRFADRIRPYLAGSQLKPVDLNLEIGEFGLTGHTGNRYGEGIFHYRFAGLNARDHLSLWIRHLALNASAESCGNCRSVLAGRDRTWSYGPVSDADALLEGLLNIYSKGLTLPVPFIPVISGEYAERILAGGGSDDIAIRAARKTWAGEGFGYAVSGDPYYSRCFGERDPLDDEFRRLSILVFEPMFRHSSPL